jgi:DNA replication protein DnaC
MALNKKRKVNNRNVKPRKTLYPETLTLLGIRADAHNVTWDDLIKGYKKALDANPNLTEKERKESFKELSEVVSIFKDYVDNIHDNFDAGTGFFMLGDNDNGKTTLLSVWVREAHRHRYDARIITMEEISAASRAFDDEDAQQLLYDLVHKYDFLVIDEVGKETEGEKKYNQTILERILKERIEKYELPTSVITNLDHEDFLARYGRSIYSVLQYLQPIVMTYSLYFRKPRQIVRGRK